MASQIRTIRIAKMIVNVTHERERTDSESLDEGVGKGVGEAFGVDLGVGDGVGEGVGDGVGAGVGDGVGAGVGDGVGALHLHNVALLQSVMRLLSKSLNISKTKKKVN